MSKRESELQKKKERARLRRRRASLFSLLKKKTGRTLERSNAPAIYFNGWASKKGAARIPCTAAQIPMSTMERSKLKRWHMRTRREGANKRMFILIDTARLKKMQPIKTQRERKRNESEIKEETRRRNKKKKKKHHHSYTNTHQSPIDPLRWSIRIPRATQ